MMAPVLESKSRNLTFRVGRLGWKDQHSSLMSACADSLRNEIGIRNQLYPEEYPTQGAGKLATPFDVSDPRTGKTELERLVDEIRRSTPPARDEQLVKGSEVQAGERLFGEIGCALCHTPTYKTLPPGTLVNGGTYKIPAFLGSQIIHPYADFLLHDIGTGDGIPQAAEPRYLNQSTANRLRTAPLWGLRFRSWMMHDGKSTTYHRQLCVMRWSH